MSPTTKRPSPALERRKRNQAHKRDRLLKAVAASGMTQREIAKAAGLDETDLSTMLSGKRGISDDKLEVLAPVLGKAVAFFRRI